MTRALPTPVCITLFPTDSSDIQLLCAKPTMTRSLFLHFWWTSTNATTFLYAKLHAKVHFWLIIPHIQAPTFNTMRCTSLKIWSRWLCHHCVAPPNQRYLCHYNIICSTEWMSLQSVLSDPCRVGANSNIAVVMFSTIHAPQTAIKTNTATVRFTAASSKKSKIISRHYHPLKNR